MVRTLSSKEKKRMDFAESTRSLVNALSLLRRSYQDDALLLISNHRAEVEGYLDKRNKNAIWWVCRRESRNIGKNLLGSGASELKVWSQRMSMTFLVVRAPSPYNIILGRPGLKALHAIPPITLSTRDQIPLQGNSNAGDSVKLLPLARMDSLRIARKTKDTPNNKPEGFAWETSDMTGCPERSRDSLIRMGKSRNSRPVKYPTYISNPVLVKKCDGSWRMCIDFKNLNSACPKDYYPLPSIDCKVEAVMGFKYKCFLDAYKRYHQIQMAREDEEKTALFRKEPRGICGDMVNQQSKDARISGRQLQKLLKFKAINMSLESLKLFVWGTQKANFEGFWPMSSERVFISNTSKTQPKKTSMSTWTSEAEVAFHEMKSSKGGRSQRTDDKNRNGDKSVKTEEEYFRMPEVPPEVDDTEIWTLFTDGAASLKGSGAVTNKRQSDEALAGFALQRMMKVSVHQRMYKPCEEEGRTRMTPIISIGRGIATSDKNEGTVLRAGPLQANYVIREIHMGSCGMHIGPRAVVRKAMRQGYYWPTMHADAKEEVEKCDSCQIHSPVPRLPKTHMTSIMAPWPFFQWGMDILGPLTPARGGAKFGLPRIIVTDNGAQLWKGQIEGSWRGFKQTSRGRAGWVDELPKAMGHRTHQAKHWAKRPSVFDLGSEAERRKSCYKERLVQNKDGTVYNKRVVQLVLRRGCLFYRGMRSRIENDGSLRGQIGKGPYRVTEAFENGSYKLQTMEDKVVPRTWHAVNLRKCYL
ncbi:reverse transcriptase domain-containing protein [Tanacetum coccineum]